MNFFKSWFFKGLLAQVILTCVALAQGAGAISFWVFILCICCTSYVFTVMAGIAEQAEYHRDKYKEFLVYFYGSKKNDET